MGSTYPSLAPHYRVIAPDYPGFGLSDAPTPAQYEYSFRNSAETVRALLRQIGVDRYSLIIQDYGGPVGLNMATSASEEIGVIVAQNMAAYDEALGPLWDARKAFWADPSSHTFFFFPRPAGKPSIPRSGCACAMWVHRLMWNCMTRIAGKTNT